MPERPKTKSSTTPPSPSIPNRENPANSSSASLNQKYRKFRGPNEISRTAFNANGAGHSQTHAGPVQLPKEPICLPQSIRPESPRPAYMRRESSHEIPSLRNFINSLLNGWRNDQDSQSASSSPTVGSSRAENKVDRSTSSSQQNQIMHREEDSFSRDSGTLTSSIQPQFSTSVDILSHGAFIFSEPHLQDYPESLGQGSSMTSYASLRTHSNASWLNMASSSALTPQPNCHSSVEDKLCGNILEPLPQGRPSHSMSEMLLLNCDTIRPLDATDAPMKGRSYRSTSCIEMNDGSFEMPPEISPDQPPLIPIVMTLPNEIIQQVYTYLSPKEFNAARHTCRTWMTAGLERPMLVLMLKRGGWWTSTNSDLSTRARSRHEAADSKESDVWFLSCRLARECALSWGWTGNGLPLLTVPSSYATAQYAFSQPLASSTSEAYEGNQQVSQFRQTASIDFTGLASGYAVPGCRHSGGLVFTVSVCNKYLLVAEGGMIYVYELYGDNIRPLTSIICPRRVLAMSMNASSRRFAIAALLDGRMGIMCDLQIGRERKQVSSPLAPGSSVDNTARRRESLRSSIFTTQLHPEDASPILPEFNARRTGQGSELLTLSNPDTISLNDSGHQQVCLQDILSERGREQNLINQTWNLHLPNYSPPRPSQSGRAPDQSIPIETGPCSLYRHLCSDDDPPRSVAICPQRQCVAFGCSAGLELHWVDALTGQDLNRWFPLTGPSDYLYFLPPRRSLDSPRKLRLISSAAHPSERSALRRRFYAAKPMPSSFWGAIGLERKVSAIAGFVSDCDHYRAVPLSDGFHILFVDPDSSMLCLGSDAPLGDPRRLLRKIILVPPEDSDVPRIYAAGAELLEGPRIVAVYGDSLVLFSVPVDVFELSRKEQRPAGVERVDIEAAAEWLDWWPADDVPMNYPSSKLDGIGGPKSVWPLFIRGIVIGQLEGVVDIAVNGVSGLSIWAFGLDGRAVVWKIDDGRQPATFKERSISRDGHVVNLQEANQDGDIVVMDADEFAKSIERPATFEGPVLGDLGHAIRGL